MRRLALTALIGLALAAPAAAASKGGQAKAAGLRGPQPTSDDASAGAPARSSPAPIARTWSAATPSPPNTDPMQCRAACAQTYYFCASSGDDDCPGRWSQCAASCSGSQGVQPN